MRSSGPLVVTLGNDPALFDDDRPHPGIRGGGYWKARDLKRSAHEGDVH
jgi:hypothetical protein